MKEAIKNYIDNTKNDKDLDDIWFDIDRVIKEEIKRARKKQLRKWRKELKRKGL